MAALYALHPAVLFQVFISLLLILNHFASCSRKLTGQLPVDWMYMLGKRHNWIPVNCFTHSANALNESCLAEGEPTSCDCQAPLQRGSMEWTGNSSTFVCPGSNTGQANLIVFALGETCSAKGQNDASCGPYFANITCNDNGYLSVLSFTANSNMNGGTILCQQNLTGAEPYQQFFIRVGGNYEMCKLIHTVNWLFMQFDLTHRPKPTWLFRWSEIFDWTGLLRQTQWLVEYEATCCISLQVVAPAHTQN